MSISVLRRYTPPTCTLEILATRSPLSQWTDRPVLKNLKFQLSFDDPRLISEDHVVIEGDRTQLDALCDAVTTYVQQLLDPYHAYPAHTVDTAAMQRNGRADAAVAEPLMDRAVAARSPAAQPVASQPSTIFLRPKGLVSHELHLGSLATTESGAIVPLSALQLFDLANALDTYATDVVALPETARPVLWGMSSKRWLQSAAVVLLAVGVSTSIFKVVTNLATPTAETASVEDPSNTTAAAPQARNTLPPAAKAPRQIPPELRPLPPSAFEPGANPNQANGNRAGQPRTPNRTQPTRPQAGDRRRAQPRPARDPALQPLPRLPDFRPIDPQIASAPNPASGTAPDALSQASRAPGPTQQDQIQIESVPPSATAAAPALESPTTLTAPTQRTTAPSPSGTAFDTIPQVAELRQVIGETWTPPTGITQTLEYRLTLNADGTVKDIAAMGESSRVYRSQVGLPTIGQSVVSPLTENQNAIFRIVLNPEGRAQVFLESVN